MPLKENLVKAVDDLKKNSSKRKFGQSIELILKLREVDLKKPENRITQSMELPHPLKKPVKVCIIASGDLAVRAQKGGADLVLQKDDVEKLSKEKKSAKRVGKEYDFFIAEAPLMPLIGKTLGQVLGPRNKMPTPVPPNAPIEDIVKKHRNMIRVRVKDQPMIQCRVGTEDMSTEEIVDNIQAVVGGIEAKLERGSKNIGAILVKATMSPPVKVTV